MAFVVRFVVVLLVYLFAASAPLAERIRCQGNDCSAPTVKVVRVGYTIFPPFSDTNDGGTAEGFSIDLLRQFLEPSGYAISFVEFDNPAQMLESLEGGGIDATSLLGVNDARARIGVYTNVFEQFSTSVFVRRDSFQINSIDDLSGLRVGSSRGSLGEKLMQDVTGAIYVPFENGRSMLWPLLSGNIDAIAAPTRSVQHQIRQTELGNLIELTPVQLRVVEAGILVNAERSELLADLNSAISRNVASGGITAISDRWFGPPPRRLTAIEIKALLITATVLLIGLGVWIKAYVRVLRQANTLTARTQQLAAALDATGSSFLVADASMRVVWWSKGYTSHYPEMKKNLKNSKTLEELIAAGFLSGVGTGRVISTQMQAEDETRTKVALLQSGQDLKGYFTTQDGRVFRQRMFKIPSGAYAAISTDVSELAAERDALRNEAELLDASNKRLERFSQMVAHDLVAPIRNQKHLLEFIREDLADIDVSLPANIYEHFDQAEILLTRQSQLVKDLLEWSHSQHHSGSEIFAPQERVKAAVSLALPPSSFSVNVPENLPDIDANPVAFEIVLRNLISNAIKHHDKSSGVVTLTHRVDASHCVFWVSDDGPGIPSEHLEGIFEPFKTLASKDAGGGSGLGLSFVKEAVTAWRGVVTALDTKGARGATFRFTVPLAHQGPQATQGPHLKLISTKSGSG